MRSVSTVTNPTNVTTERKIRTPSAAYPREYTGERHTNAIQDNVANVTAPARSLVQDNQVIFEDLAFTAGQTQQIEHKLGRAYRSFAIERIRGTHPISVKEVAQNDTELDKRIITLNASTACTVNLRVW